VYLFVAWTVSSLFYFFIVKSAGANAADGAYTSGLMRCPAKGPYSPASISADLSPALVGSGA
jgi:hypothetical protein